MFLHLVQSNEVPLLDDTQQNAVLDEFRRQARAARRQTQLIIGPLGTALCLAYFYFAIQALLDPWSVRHHAELIDVLRPVAIAAGEAISGVAMAGSLAAVIANCRLRPALGRSILQSSVLTTILVSLFWSMALAKMLRLRSYELVRGGGRGRVDGVLPLCRRGEHACGFGKFNTCQNWPMVARPNQVAAPLK